MDLNPFNGMKVLAHADKIDAILNGNFKSPVSCEIDPSNLCNHHCPNCMFKEFNKSTNVVMPKDVLFNLIKELAEFGLKSIAFTGGGEPLTSPYILEAMKLSEDYGLEVGLITNGGLFNQESIDIALKTCKFIRISLDAGTKETHKKIHGTKEHEFDNILSNLAVLSNKNVGTDIGVAFLVHPINYGEIIDIARILKEIGVNYLQIRPMWLKNGILPYQVIHGAQEHIRISQKLNNDGFTVYGIMHRFDEHLYETRQFNKCRATPLLGVVAADCNLYLCCQFRGEKGWEIGNLNNENFSGLWGGKNHKELIKTIDLNKCIPCRYKQYNQVIEQVNLKDKMHRNFL